MCDSFLNDVHTNTWDRAEEATYKTLEQTNSKKD